MSRMLVSLSAILLLVPHMAAIAAGDHAHNDMSKAIAEYRELTATEKMVQGVLDTYARAMAEGSIEVMEDAIIPGDFSTIESGYPNWTWEDFRDTHLTAEFKAFDDASYDIDLIVGETLGSLGFAVFRYTAAGKIQDAEISISGLGTAILEETNAGWRIHHMHTSAPRTQLEQAAAGAAAAQKGAHDAATQGHEHGGDAHQH